LIFSKLFRQTLHRGKNRQKDLENKLITFSHSDDFLPKSRRTKSFEKMNALQFHP